MFYRPVFYLARLLTLGGFVLLMACGFESPATPLPLDLVDDEHEVPGNSDTETGPEEGAAGAPCESNEDCQGTTCLTGGAWPGGYCTTPACTTDADCSGAEGDSICLDHPDLGPTCVSQCNTVETDSCRPGYQCTSLQASTGWCTRREHTSGGGGHWGDWSGVVDTGGDFPFATHCVAATDGWADIEFEIASTTTSYMIVPYTTSQSSLHPFSLTLPSGQLVDFHGDNSFQTHSFNFAGLNPLIVPAAPQFAHQLEAGVHHLRLDTNGSEVCYFLLESQANATKLDINFYFIGLDEIGLNADTAADHQAFQDLLSTTNQIYAQAGFSIGEARYFDVDEAVEEEFSVIRSDNDIPALLAHSRYPGTTRDSARSVNVFLTRQITHGPLGVSMGAPGVAGIHQSWLSGVIVSGEYLGEEQFGVRYTAVTLAHETGHFLGQAHTSEINGQEFDILSDTPECSPFENRRPWNCPDWGNLMFPIAGPNNFDISQGQNHIFQVSPLTK